MQAEEGRALKAVTLKVLPVLWKDCLRRRMMINCVKRLSALTCEGAWCVLLLSLCRRVGFDS